MSASLNSPGWLYCETCQVWLDADDSDDWHVSTIFAGSWDEPAEREWSCPDCGTRFDEMDDSIIRCANDDCEGIGSIHAIDSISPSDPAIICAACAEPTLKPDFEEAA